MAWPVSNFPTSLDSITDKVDNTDTLVAADMNGAYDCIEKIEAKVGVDNSAKQTSLDWKLRSTSSRNPGHKHTLSTGATDLLSGSLQNRKFFINDSCSGTEWKQGIKGQNFTRALDADSAIVAYTGFGFRPSCLIILAAVDYRVSLGFSYLGTSRCFLWYTRGSSGGMNYSSSKLIYILTPTDTEEQVAQWTATSNDGFSLQWTKTGSPPSGTINFYVLAFR